MRFKDISESQLEKFKKIGQWLDYVNSKANKDSTAEEIKELLKDSPTQEDSYAYQLFISKYKIVGMKDGEFICYGDH